MSKTDDAPYELFKQALATTAKAMSQTRDVEVAFSGDGPRAEAERIILPPPPRDLSPEQAALARGEADATALRMAHHDPVAHAKHRPQTDLGRQVYEAAERARIESIGARAMDGTAGNLDAALAARCEKSGYTRMEDRQEAPLAPAVEFLLRERLTGRALPQEAEGVAALWREEVNARGTDTLDRLIDQLHDQEAFAKSIQELIRHLTKGDEVADDQGEQDEASDEEADQNNQENSSEDGESGEETQGATMEEIEAGDTDDMDGEETNVSVDSEPIWTPKIILTTQMMAPSHCARIIVTGMMPTGSSIKRSPARMTKSRKQLISAIRRNWCGYGLISTTSWKACRVPFPNLQTNYNAA